MSAPGAPRPLELRARDGRSLAGLLLEAPGVARGALAINGATGFRREFYLKFATYCAARGYHTLVYDYRGIGASARSPLSSEDARMSDWGRLDMPARSRRSRRASCRYRSRPSDTASAVSCSAACRTTRSRALT